MDERGRLRRLEAVWQKNPVYFITACVDVRRAVLASDRIHHVLREEWSGLHVRHGWMVGRYVVMPDHVHFFIAPDHAAVNPMAQTVGKWKEWTAKRIIELTASAAPLWQPGFFDHVLRSSESRSEKWSYVRENPVRAGLVGCAEEWPYAGSIDFE